MGIDPSQSQRARNALAFISDVEVFATEDRPHRRTSIICTLGPASHEVSEIRELMQSGLAIARMNFSHGNHEYHRETIRNVRAAAALEAKAGVESTYAIALDTKGPEIRTGNTMSGNDVQLSAGSTIVLSCNPADRDACTSEKIFVDFAGLPTAVHPGHRVFIDDGLINLKVIECKADSVIVEVQNSGPVGSHKGVNLPDSADTGLPALSAKDKADLTLGVEEDVDMIFASFIRSADDVLAIRAHLGEAGKHIKIISKIENREGIDNYKAILAVTDGIMVARGDLGIEIPAHKVFVAQKKMIALGMMAGKPVIVATQMLESMVENPRPTRAEVSDVANAVLDGADCVMLSGETAKGKYPAGAVSFMADICREAEGTYFYRPLFDALQDHAQLHGAATSETVAISAVNAAFTLNAAAIVCITRKGDTAGLVSKYRPTCPVIALSRDERVCRQVHLYRSVLPFHYTKERIEPWREDVNLRVNHAIAFAMRRGICKVGDSIIVLHGLRGGITSRTNLMRVVQVEEAHNELSLTTDDE